jgi:hypothetical protein
MKYNDKTYIEKCISVHGDKYDYSFIEYSGSNTKDKIICKKHGIFEQLAFCHIQGQSCPKCNIDDKKIGINDFILNASKKHDNKYQYNLTKFDNRKDKVKIICNIHGVFTQRASDHLRGSGCPCCYKDKNRMSNNEFVKRSSIIHNNKYNYIDEYKKSHSNIKIECVIHGEFSQKPYAHLSGQGCPKCSVDYNDRDSFIRHSTSKHGGIYKYDNVDYENSSSKVKILCTYHGLFKMTPRSHSIGQRCPKCAKIGISKSEVEWLDELSISESNIHRTINIGNRKFYVDAIVGNIIYEFYGDYWHGNPKKYKFGINGVNKKPFTELYKKTIEREKILKENGYEIVYIWESDFKNKNKK